MIDDALKRAIAGHESILGSAGAIARIQKEADKLAAMLRPLEASFEMRSVAEEFARHEKVLRAALGPVEELRRIGMSDNVAALSNWNANPLQNVFANIEQRFRVPAISEMAQLLQEIDCTSVASILKKYDFGATRLRDAIQAMEYPWLDRENLKGSLAGFVELQSIGYALREMHSFDETLANALRAELGDWQQTIAWPANIFDDPIARTEFYSARGLNPALTMFPSEAFEQSISIAGLSRSPAPASEHYYRGGEDLEESTDEVGLVRTNAAHDRLQRFESQVRGFIHEQMSRVIGPDWIRHRVPGELRKAWLEKRQKALENGEQEYSLIAYADFTDYVPIITRKDNWNEIFGCIFRRKEFVQESFQRLYPIRICTMHARIITQDDELYLLVETKRLLNAIGIME